MSEEKFSQAPWDIEEPVKDDELRYNDGYNYTIWGGHKKHRHSLALVLCNGRPGDADYPQHCFDEAIEDGFLPIGGITFDGKEFYQAMIINQMPSCSC
jgi:hypothetical protein